MPTRLLMHENSQTFCGKDNRKGNRKKVVNWEVCTTLGSLYDSYAYVAVAEQDV